VPASCSDNNPEDDWRPNDASQCKHLHSELTGVVRARIEEPVPRATLTGWDWILLHHMHKMPLGPYRVTHTLPFLLLLAYRVTRDSRVGVRVKTIVKPRCAVC
jgi:hypothetical protein